MKFSEAMRIGAKKGKQLFVVLESNGDTCAMGAAILGTGVPAEAVTCAYYQPLKVSYGFLATAAKCPVCGVVPTWAGSPESGCVTGVVIHLNNDHRWTREAIADWIERTYESGNIPAKEILEYCGMVPQCH